jgi:hypothetical protein
LKLKVTPILIAVVASAAVLFGGWFIYHSVALESPLNHALNETAGVVDYKASISGAKTVFNIQLDNQANIREIVHKISQKNDEVAGDRVPEIKVTSNTSPQLEDWWSTALFDVAQAMETRRYADIPVALNAKADQIQGLSVQTEMDDDNVYVRLTEGEHVKFVILPRTAAKMGVWSQ